MKDKIRQTAIALFKENGIRKMSVQKLADALGISTKTVYKYYDSKDRLFYDVINAIQQEKLQTFKMRRENRSPVSLFIDSWYQAFEREYQTSNHLFYDLHNYYLDIEQQIEKDYGDLFWEEYRQVFNKGKSEGLFIESIDVNIALEGISVLYGTTCRTDQFAKFNVPHYILYLNTIIPFIRGICTEKGRIEVDEYLKNIKS
jgi:AcrR family transcriptional regulator